MKTLQRLLLLILAMPLLASHCEKENFDILPPETQEGKNTFGCLINGEVFVKGYAPWMHPRISAYYYDGSSKHLTIDSYLYPKGYIQMHIENPFIDQQLKITVCYYAPRNGDYSECFYFGGRNVGNITITKLDTINKIVSGRFNFDGQCSNEFVNPVGDSIVHITQGRFDIKLDVYD